MHVSHFPDEASIFPSHHYDCRLYRIWSAMKQRCKNPRLPGYKAYGGRGITVCAEWENYLTFRNWAISNGYRDDLTIERIDVNGNYCPENCTWADRYQQANNKTNNRIIEFNGKRMTSRQWDRELGFRAGVISDRLNTLGWDLERAMTEPVGTSHAKKLTYNGETHTIAEWSRILGISFTSLCKRINDPKWSMEDVFTKPKAGEGNLLTYNGETLPFCQWAKKLGIPNDTLFYRIYKAHWPIEKALSTPVRHYTHNSPTKKGHKEN